MNFSVDLNGQVALVTGGASGIGRAITNNLINSGARVIVVDRREDRLSEMRQIYPDTSQLLTYSGDICIRAET